MLQNYTFKVTHRSGKRMAHVDALSRLVMVVESLSLERELEFRQLQDMRLKEIAHNLEYNDNDKFELIEGLVYKKGSDRTRFVVPETMINAIIRTYQSK